MPRFPLPACGLAPDQLAAFARLRYVCDADAGFTRKAVGGGFEYLSPQGRPVRDPRLVARFEQLVIPPAWQEVWICRHAKGHLQATGRDSRKRKQYLYHPRWSEISNLVKFWRLGNFGEALPALRRAVAKDLLGAKLSRTRVLAGVVGLLDATSIRIGHEEYVAQNNSYGLTTLRDRHVTVGRASIELRFVGKGGFRKVAVVDDPALVRLVKQSRALRGAHLFQYLDGQKARSVTAADVNEYLHAVTGQPFSAKDFRTWKASALVAGTLYEYRELDRLSQRRRIMKTVVHDAAASLGNTPTVCRNYYIHPGLLSTYQDGTFSDHLNRFKPRARKQLAVAEQVLQRFLDHWSASQGPLACSA